MKKLYFLGGGGGGGGGGGLLDMTQSISEGRKRSQFLSTFPILIYDII